MTQTTPSLQPGDQRPFVLGAVVLFVALVLFAWMSWDSQQTALRREVVAQGQELALSLEDVVDGVRAHAFTAQTTVAHALMRWSGPRAQEPALIRSESAALFVDPAASLDPTEYDRTLRAASKMLPGTAAMHQWNPIFQWSYFYDAQARWFLIYPYLSQDDLFRSTQTGELSAAMSQFFDAGGTRPLQLIGPRDNPQREMRWTRSYEDAAGKGRMVTLLAPVYLADEFVGCVGTDVTLAQLDDVLKRHPIRAGRALVVDAMGTVLADSAGALKDPKREVSLGQLLPDADKAAATSRSWQRIPIPGTSWTLVLHVPNSALQPLVVADLWPSMLIAVLLMLALLGWLWTRQRHSEDLGAASAVLEQTKGELARADKLGTLGGLVASVSREIEQPLSQAKQTLSQLQSGLRALDEQMTRGLRRAELDTFLASAAANSQAAAAQLGEAGELLQSFRQLAVDQAREGARRFVLRDMVNNVLAVLRPALKRQGATVTNDVAAELELVSDPGTLGHALNHAICDALGRVGAGQVLTLTAGWNSGRQGELLELTLSDAGATAPEAGSEGLAQAQRLLKLGLGGELQLQSGPGGHSVTLSVPTQS